jgi:hypothetical protein
MIRNLLSVIVLAGFFYLGCVVYMNRTPKSEPPTAEQPTPTPSVSPKLLSDTTPSPAPVQLASAATPRPKRFASPGVYYLTERISLMTDSGIRGFRPGTKVIVMKKLQTKWLVTDGVTDIEVSPNHLTNDLDVAGQLLQSDQASHPTAKGNSAR